MRAFTKIYSLLIAAMVFSCGSNEVEETVTDPADSTREDAPVTDSPEAAVPFSQVARSPKQTYETDSIRIESYDFEQLEPFLHQQDDFTYVINFWATWCKPCVAELPYFEQLRENYKDKQVHVMLVSIDFSKAVETTLVPFLKERQLKSEVVLLDDPDANSWISKVDANWSGAIPATVIYNREKRLFHEGSMTYEELEAKLLEIKD